MNPQGETRTFSQSGGHQHSSGPISRPPCLRRVTIHHVNTSWGRSLCCKFSIFQFLRLAYTHSYACTAPCSSPPLMRTCRAGVVGTAVPAGGPTGTGWGYQKARPPSPSPVTPEEFLFSRMTQSEPDVSPDRGRAKARPAHSTTERPQAVAVVWSGRGRGSVPPALPGTQLPLA